MRLRLLIGLLVGVTDFVFSGDGASARSSLRATVLSSAMTNSTEPVPSQSTFAVPTCACQCCVTTRRMQHEMDDESVFLKCASKGSSQGVTADAEELSNEGPSHALKKATQVHSCPSTCDARMEGDKDSVPWDLNKFCFYRCKPYDFTPGQVCCSLSKDELKAATDKNGDPLDHGLSPLTANAGPMPPSVAPPRVVVTPPPDYSEWLEKQLFEMKKMNAEAKGLGNYAIGANQNVE